MPSADIAPVSVRRAVRGRTWPATTRDTDVVAGPSRWGTLQAVDITRFMPTYSSPADGVRSPLTVSSQAPIPGLSDPDIPGGGCLISGALPGVTGMLILTMVGVALGRRHTKLDDTAGVDRLRFMP